MSLGFGPSRRTSTPEFHLPKPVLVSACLDDEYLGIMQGSFGKYLGIIQGLGFRDITATTENKMGKKMENAMYTAFTW